MIDLTGKTAIVTGGSRGIGRATCLALAEAGANVALGFQRNQAAAQTVVDEIRAKGKHAIAIQGTVSQRETFERLFNQARETFGPVDVAVGNAAVWKRAPIDEMTEEEWQEMMDVNLKSAYFICHFAAREMKPRRTGTIILVSSTAGQRGEAFHSHYAATKGAIISLTKSLASELGPWNIRVNCVAPGWVNTDMAAGFFSDRDSHESVRKAIPLGAIATAEEIAGAILFLASDLASQVHGEVLNVNGGSVLCG